MKGEEGDIKVYFSHKRVGDGLSKFAQSLYNAGNAEHGFVMNTDCIDADHSKFIDEFVDGLISSPYVIFLLNDGYFESPWCMFEFLGYMDRHELGVSGYFISCDGWLDSERNPIFKLDGYNAFIKFWEKKKEDDDIRVREVAKRILNESIFSESYDSLSPMRQFFFKEEKRLWGWCETDRSLRKTASEGSDINGMRVIWDRFRQVRARKAQELKPHSYDELSYLAKKKVEEMVGTPAAREESALIRSLKVGIDSEKDGSVSSYLWSLSPDQACNYLFRRTEAALRRCNSRERFTIKRDAVDFLGLLLLRMLDFDYRSSVFPHDKSPLDKTIIQVQDMEEIVPDLLLGALSSEDVGAKIQYYEGAFLPERGRRIDRDLKGKSYLDTAEDDIESWGLIIWEWVTKSGLSAEKKSLGEHGWKRLARMLQGDFERGHGRYIVLGSNSNPRVLKNDGIAKALRFNLPYLFIIEIGVEEKNVPRLLDLNRGDVEMDILRAFGDLFSDYPD